jgi:hypothetical protein
MKIHNNIHISETELYFIIFICPISAERSKLMDADQVPADARPSLRSDGGVVAAALTTIDDVQVSSWRATLSRHPLVLTAFKFTSS